MKKSNIELLRIVLFLMVVSIHVTSVGLVMGEIQRETFQWYYASLMRLFVAPAVICFILLSGYLMVNKNFNLKKYLTKLAIPFFIYFPILLWLDFSVAAGGIAQKIYSVFSDFMGVVGVFYHLWYIFVLIILAFLIPYANKLLSLCSKKQHLGLFLMLLAISTINNTTELIFNRQFFSGLLGSDSRIFLFISLYITGAYFGKYRIKIKKRLLLLVYISIPILTFIYSALNSRSVLSYVELSYLFIVLQGICLFLFFTEIEFKNNIVDFLGGLVFGGYIIHVFFINYIQNFLPFTTFFGSRYYFLVDLSFVVMVAIASLTTEMIRMYFYRILMHIFNSYRLILKDL